MTANSRNRHSLEPLAAALVVIGSLHLLVGYLVLNVLSETHRNNVTKASSNLVWKAPADFLVDQKVPIVPPLPKAVLKTPVIASPAVPARSEGQTLKSAPVPAIPAPKTPPEKTLAATSKANRDLLSPLASSASIGPEAMQQTVASKLPAIQSRKDSAVSIPSLQQAPPAPATVTVPPPVGPEPSPAPVTAETGSSGNQQSANKYITLSVILPPGSTPARPGSNKPVLNLLDIVNLNANQRAEDTEAGGADMDPVDKALQQAILKAWIAPEIASVPPSQRRATMELAILRDGAIEDAAITVSSGSSLLDTSIRQAAERLKKISVRLPSNFPKERYKLRVNFQIE
jgi:hypothetical protein